MNLSFAALILANLIIPFSDALPFIPHLNFGKPLVTSCLDYFIPLRKKWAYTEECLPGITPTVAKNVLNGQNA